MASTSTTRREWACEHVRWAMGFLSYLGEGAASDSWEEVRSRARQHAAELAEAVAELDGDESPAPQERDDVHAVYADVRTFLGVKAPALAERFELAFLHTDADAGMREVDDLPARIAAPAPGVDLAELAANLQPGGYLSLTIYGTPVLPGVLSGKVLSAE